MSKISYSPPTPQELKKALSAVGGIFFFLGTVFLVFLQFVNGKHPIKAAVFLSVGTFLILMAAIPPTRSRGLLLGLPT